MDADIHKKCQVNFYEQHNTSDTNEGQPFTCNRFMCRDKFDAEMQTGISENQKVVIENREK